jgi:DNA-binding LacI/PurR family transcriptional regulator
VSRVLNGSPQVTPEAVEQVTAAVKQLNYVPNRAARNLVRRRTQMIAMVIPERTSEFFADPYFAEVIQGAALYASSTDYTLTLLIESDTDPEKTRRFLTGGNVDGALVLSHHSSMQSYADLSPSLPVVFGVRPLETIVPEPYVVDADNVAGRTRIATITGPLDTAAGLDRLEGWRRALEGAGLAEGPQAEGTFTPASGAAAMQRILDTGQPVDAVFAASAQMASGAMGRLREHGLSVPADIAVTAVDNNFFAADTAPGLTTVDLHTADKGALLVETLHRLLARETVEHTITIGSTLVERGSA